MCVGFVMCCLLRFAWWVASAGWLLNVGYCVMVASHVLCLVVEHWLLLLMAVCCVMAAGCCMLFGVCCVLCVVCCVLLGEC